MMAPPTAWFRKVLTARQLFRAASARLFAASIMLGAVAAHAQSISNIASAQWNVGGEAYSVQSNLVSFAVTLPDAVLHTYAPMPGAPETAELLPDYCAIANSDGGLSPQSVETVSTPIFETDTLLIGQTLVLRLDAPAANTEAWSGRSTP